MPVAGDAVAFGAAVVHLPALRAMDPTGTFFLRMGGLPSVATWLPGNIGGNIWAFVPPWDGTVFVPARQGPRPVGFYVWLRPPE